MAKVEFDLNNKQDKDWLILCDVGGTLLEAKLGEPVNQILLSLLAAYNQEGFKVVLFAERPASVQGDVHDMCRKYYGDPALFGAVQPKSAFAGADAFMVIDDDHGSHKVKTSLLLDPVQNERTFAKMANFALNVCDEIDRITAERKAQAPGLRP